MTSDADRDLLLKWLASPEGESILDTLQAALKAREQLRGANSDTAREKAEQAVLAAAAALEKRLGKREVVRRHTLRGLDDLEAGAPVDAQAYDARMRIALRDGSRAGRVRLRFAMDKMVRVSAGDAAGDAADHLAAALVQLAGGRDSILHIDRSPGTNPDTGAAFMLRFWVVGAVGYDAGVRYGRKGRVEDVLWAEAAAVHNAAAEKLRREGEPCPAVNAATIKLWCQRIRDKNGKVLEEHKRFESTRAQGARAAEIGLVDPDYRLAAVGKINRL